MRSRSGPEPREPTARAPRPLRRRGDYAGDQVADADDAGRPESERGCQAAEAGLEG